MKKIAVLISLFLLSYQITQSQPGTGYLYVGGLGQRLTAKDRAGSAVREVYLDTTWRKATIVLNDLNAQSIENVPIKYDLRANVLELKDNSGVKILDLKWVKSLTLLDAYNLPHQFVSGKHYRVEGTPLVCLIEILSPGKIALLKRHSFWIKPPDEMKVLGTGSPDEHAYREDFLLYSPDNENLLKIPNKKKLLLAFGESGPSVEKFIKENKLSVSNEYDLVRIFEFYNNQKN